MSDRPKANVPPPTGTVAVVVTNLRGASEIAKRDPHAAKEVVELHAELLRSLLRKHHGYESQQHTYAFLLAFSDPGAAVRWALEVQEEFREVDWPTHVLGASEPPSIGIAIHYGPVDSRHDTEARMLYRGASVNKAVAVGRICRAAQTILTSRTWEAVRGHVHAEGEEANAVQLQGWPEPLDLILLLPGRGKMDAAYMAVDAGLEEERTDNLPEFPTSFVGRGRDLDELGEAVKTTQLLTMLGPGGTGKTRLVCHFASSNIAKYPGGIWFADLSDARTLDGVLKAVGMALEIPLTLGGGLDDDILQLGYSLASRDRCLLVMDNFEQVVEHAEQTVAGWMKQAPEARFIVTSRHVLELEGEHILRIKPLSQDDAVELFVERATEVNPRFEISNLEERELVTELVERLDRIALAIELAAGRSKLIPLRPLLDGLSRRLQILSSGDPEARERQASLRGAIDWSWRLLSESEHHLLKQVCLFRRGFAVEAAEAIVDLEPFGDGWVLEVIDGLVNKSMLHASDSPGFPMQTRFWLLENVCEFVREKLEAEEGALEDLQYRMGILFRSLGEAWALGIHGPKGRDSVARLALEMETMVSLHEALRVTQPSTAVRLVLAMDTLLAVSGPFDSRLALLDSAEAVCPRDEPELRARILRARGTARGERGHPREAETDLKHALNVARFTGNRAVESEVRSDLGQYYFGHGRLELARQQFRHALDAQRGLVDMAVEGAVLGELGRMHFEQGRLQEAQASYTRSLSMLRQVGDRRAEAVVMANLGQLHLQAGRNEEALDHFQLALAIQREVGDKPNEARVLGFVGTLLLDLGRVDEAKDHYNRALRIHGRVGNRRMEAQTVGSLGNLEQDLGALPSADEYFRRSLSMFRELEDVRMQGILLGNVAAVAHERGQRGEAREGYQRSLSCLRDARDHRLEGVMLARLGALEAASDNLLGARDALSRARALLEACGDTRNLQALEIHVGQLNLAAMRAARRDRRGDSSNDDKLHAGALGRMSRATQKGPPDEDYPDGTPPPVTRSKEIRFAVRLLRQALDVARGY